MKILSLMVLLCVVACGPNYKEFYKLDKDYLARRQIQTKRFETADQKSVLVASAQVLQDLGYVILESEIEAGLITAKIDKEMAGKTAKQVGAVFLSLLGGGEAIYDTKQRIFVTLTTKKERNNTIVRVAFTRIIWDNKGQARMERINNIEVYEGFFDKLSESIFLTAYDI